MRNFLLGVLFSSSFFVIISIMMDLKVRTVPVKEYLEYPERYQIDTIYQISTRGDTIAIEYNIKYLGKHGK